MKILYVYCHPLPESFHAAIRSEALPGLKEAGQVLGISEPTAVRWWTYSKTWLYQAVQETRGPAKG